MKYRNNKEIDAEINAVSTPESGARGDNCGPNETLQKGHSHKTQTEFTAREVKGAHRKAADQQIYGNPAVEGGSNPKRRTNSGWGIKNDVTEEKQ
jgi:hypothetical protein